ncbi:hypothetical protein EDC04DRAFT_2612461 [Pisolithus marmoratus]|nr:hypothetical protein EDC04DRAFT_2612461 [Pisolithus marmoratus]
MSTATSQEQWLFRQSSPIVTDGVTRIIISHIPAVAAVPKDVTPLILQRFTPLVPSVSRAEASSRRSEGETLAPQVEDNTATHSPGEASQPSSRHTPSITVSPRKLYKFRDTAGVFHWFRSEGNDPLSFPPSHIENVEEGDIFFYWVKSVGKCQMWIWRSVGGVSTWIPAREGEQIKGNDGTVRYLVVTDGRQPSLVLAVTWERRIKYYHSLTLKKELYESTALCQRVDSVLKLTARTNYAISTSGELMTMLAYGVLNIAQNVIERSNTSW